MKEKVINIRDQIIAKRYLIAGIIFVGLVIFKVNGSSIGMWDSLISEPGEPQVAQKEIFGHARAIRSDEWLVQTPFSFSQTNSGYDLINRTLSVKGQNMILAYNSPMRNIYAISKPFNWGYILFGSEYGLSWSWYFKLIGLVLLSFEMGLILTRRNKNFALLSAIWIPLSPAIQWWFVSPVSDLVFFMLGIIVSTYYYFFYHGSSYLKLLCCSIFIICATGFVLVLYPPLQVPFAFLIIAIYIAFFFEFKNKIKLTKTDFWNIGISLLVTFGIVISAVLISKDAILALLNTSYPGERFNSGGGGSVAELSSFLTNWLLPYRDINFNNNSEVSMFYNFLPITLIFTPFLFYKNKKENVLGICLYVTMVLNLIWIFVPFPRFIAKLSLMSYVILPRAYLSLSFISMLLSIWFVWKLGETKKNYIVVGLITTVLMFFFYRYSILHTLMGSYFSQKSLWISLIGFSLLIFTIFMKNKIYFFTMIIGLSLVSGIYVNPINIGTGAIYNKKLSQEIIRIDKKNPEGEWLSDVQTPVYNLLPALGVKALNTVVFYPEMDAWKSIDPKREYKDIYNRYAHIRVWITGNEKTTFELLAPDIYRINFTVNDLQKYNITNVVSSNPELENMSTSKVKFSKEYGPDRDNYSIYSVTYK